VSAIHRAIGNTGPYDRYIQTDAAINQGNSGGPMFDLNGNVVGINSAIYSPSGGNVGIGFAIPAEEARPIVMQLMKGQRIRRGYLGVQIQLLSDDIAAGLNLPKDRGAIIARVEPNGPAAKAGLQQGDVVVKVNNQDVTPDASLSFLVAQQPVGARIPIEIIRNGRHQVVTATLAERPAEDQIASIQNGDGDDSNGAPNAPAPSQSVRASLGVSLQTITPAIAQQLGIAPTTRGAVISNVDSSSDAATKGLQPRDLILGVGQRPVANAAEVAQAVDAAKRAGQKTVLLLVQRGNRPATYLGVDLTGK
jgi:serine protease Do